MLSRRNDHTQCIFDLSNHVRGSLSICKLEQCSWLRDDRDWLALFHKKLRTSFLLKINLTQYKWYHTIEMSSIRGFKSYISLNRSFHVQFGIGMDRRAKNAISFVYSHYSINFPESFETKSNSFSFLGAVPNASVRRIWLPNPVNQERR